MRLNDVLKVNSGALGFEGMHRVLWLNRKSDEIVTIGVPDIVGGERPAYVKGPVARSLGAFEASLESGDLIATPHRLAGIFTMSDATIRARYPVRHGFGGNALATRDDKYESIEELVGQIREDRGTFFMDIESARKKMREAAGRSSKPTNEFYNAIHRYLALACGKNSQLPFTFACGAPGKEKEQNNSLGNTSNAFKSGLVESPGYVLKDSHKESIGWGYKVFKQKKASLEDAYIQTCGVFWSDGDRIVDGQTLPKLLPRAQRPSFEQFKTWGPAWFDNDDAWKTVLNLNEFEMKYRALFGSGMDGIAGVGQFGLCDGTSIDNQLVSRLSRLDPIGSAERQIILEGFSTMICGYHMGLDAPSQQTAMLAVLSAATSSVEFCKRYGVDIEEGDIPAVFFDRYIVDNGEFRTANIMKTLSHLDSGLEFVSVGRGDKKPYPESKHKSLHKKTGHKIDGSTYGKQRARGEDAPALSACWRVDERTRLDLKAIRYQNCYERVEEFMNAHPFGTRMKADGVPPYRKAIYEWGVREGLVLSPPFNIDVLRASLLPTIRAVIRPNGVFLLRPDKGRRIDIIKAHRFIGPRLTELGLMEKARRSGVLRMDVHHDPSDLTRIWFADDLGFHELKNVSNDLSMVRTGTLYEAAAMQDLDSVDRELARDDDEQALSDLVIARSVDNEHFRREKQKEIRDQKKKPTKKWLTSRVKESRAREKAMDLVDAADQPIVEQHDAVTPPVSDGLDSILNEHRDG